MKSLLAALAAALTLAAGNATAAGADGGLTLVYWSARDCRWCTWWEGSVIGSGGEAKFLASPEGRAVHYTVVKKPTLALPFREADFKPDQKWLWPRVRDESDGKIKGYPSFSLYDGQKLVVYALGEEEIADKLLPAIRARMKP
ncbi:MAG: hypothetical protein IT523_03755 [Burkholderiales bacterium]|nr:hypothetical protein [Pseudomonadota bacterium]MCC7067547.1 hypothetical protein [Burkholderiales bacterium]MCZ2136413.1 hypothetical protein [Burkholderiales bacterium]